MKDIKISGKQIFWMIAIIGYGVTDLITIRPAVNEAKQDAWISTFIAMVVAILIMYFATKVNLLHPTETLIEIIQTILGKWIGKIIAISFFIMWYTVTPIIMRQSTEVIKEMLLPRTPIFIIVFPMVVLAAYATFQGLESIARCSEIVGPVMFLVYTVLVVLILKEIQWKYVLPIYSNTGVLPILKGALSPASFLCGSISMIMMLAPFMVEPNKAPSRGMWGISLAGIFLTIVTLVVIATLSPNLTAKQWYPAFEAVRFISVENFIQNLDAVIVVVWLSSSFIKFTLFFFITCYGTSQWLGIKNWRNTIWVIAPFIYILALVPRNVIDINILYPIKFLIPFVFPVNLVGIPLLLWIVGTIRKRILTG